MPSTFGRALYDQHNAVVEEHPLVGGGVTISARKQQQQLQFSAARHHDDDDVTDDDRHTYTTAWSNPAPFELHRVARRGQEEGDDGDELLFHGTSISNAYRAGEPSHLGGDPTARRVTFRMHGASDQQGTGPGRSRNHGDHPADSDDGYDYKDGGDDDDDVYQIRSARGPFHGPRGRGGGARSGRGQGRGRWNGRGRGRGRGRSSGQGRGGGRGRGRGKGRGSGGVGRGGGSIPPQSVRKKQALVRRREEGWNSRFAVPGVGEPDGPDVTVANRDRRGFFDDGRIRKDEVFRITEQDTLRRAAIVQQKRERDVVKRLARRAKLEVFMQEGARQRARIHRQTEERAVAGVPAYMQPTFASTVREVDERTRREAQAEVVSRGPRVEDAPFLQPTFSSRERGLQRDLARGRSDTHQQRIREAGRSAAFREGFEQAERVVAVASATQHELADAAFGAGTARPRHRQKYLDNHFDDTYRRRHDIPDNPIELAKKKLEAACYGYGRNWGRLFRALDIDGSGSLDAEEFRLGLRRVARVPRRQLTDRDIEHLFSAVDSSHNNFMEAREFVEFMSLQLTPAWHEARRHRERQHRNLNSPNARARPGGRAQGLDDPPLSPGGGRGDGSGAGNSFDGGGGDSGGHGSDSDRGSGGERPRTPLPRNRAALSRGMQAMQQPPQHPGQLHVPADSCDVEAENDARARAIGERAVALGTGLPVGSPRFAAAGGGDDAAGALLGPAVAAQLSHRQRATVESLLTHLTRADYDILQHCVQKMVEPATRRAYAQHGLLGVGGRPRVLHSGEAPTPAVLDAAQLEAVLEYVRQTVDGINKVAKSVEARAAAAGAATARTPPGSPLPRRREPPARSSGRGMFSRESPSAAALRREAEALERARREREADSQCTAAAAAAAAGQGASPSVVLRNLGALTDMIAADLVRESVLDSAAGIVVDAQAGARTGPGHGGDGGGSGGGAEDYGGGSGGGLQKILADMARLEKDERRIAERWGVGGSFRDRDRTTATRQQPATAAGGVAGPRSGGGGTVGVATATLRRLEDAGLLETTSRPLGGSVGAPRNWEAEIAAQHQAEVEEADKEKRVARILHHVRQYKRAKVGLPTPSSSLSRHAYRSIFGDGGSGREGGGGGGEAGGGGGDNEEEAALAEAEALRRMGPLQLADVLGRPELLGHLADQIMEEVLGGTVEELDVLWDDMTTNVMEDL